MKLNQIAQWLNQDCNSDADIANFVIDSRIIQPGDVFIALPGATHHGHHFIQAAHEKGALAAITDKACPNVPMPQFVVQDCLQALTDIATAHRQQIACPTIALTGSNGKTTVKEMIHACLPKPALATIGNLNNHIGVPLSVLRLRPDHRFAVFEQGANHLGEIAHTVKVTQPDVALINNIAPAHIEGFGSIDGVAKAKGEIYAGLGKDGTAIINDDDAYHHYWDDIIQGRAVIRFSTQHKADVYADGIEFNSFHCARFKIHFPNQQFADIQLQVPGHHMIANAVAAASCLTGLGISLEHIVDGLNSFQGVAGRFSLVKGANGSCLIDDSYNANLGSTKRAIEALAHYPGTRILVMGPMGELGEWGEEHHQQVGQIAKEHGIDQVLTLGDLTTFTSQAFGHGAHHFHSIDDLISYAADLLTDHVTLLVKGSRSARMERVVEALADNALNK